MPDGSGRKRGFLDPIRRSIKSHQVRVRWREGGELREQLSQRPTELISQLAARLGGEVPALEVARTSLEEAYLALIANSEQQK